MAWSMPVDGALTVGTKRYHNLRDLTKLVADSIAQCITQQFLLDSNKTWESFSSETETIKFVRKNHSHIKKGMLPSLDNCDASVLTSLLDEFLPDWSQDVAIQKVRDLRNTAAHQVTGSLSAQECKAKKDNLIGEIEFFQKNYSGFAELESLKRLVENRKNFPDFNLSSNIHDIEDIVGREQDVDLLAKAFESSPLVLITGPGGIGKSSLALTFAKEQTKQPLNVCLFVIMKDFEINNEFGLKLEDKICRSIGKCMSDIEKEIQNSDDAFSVLKNYINSIPEETKIWLILDNIDNFDTLEARTALENVITRLSSSKGNVKFVCTSRNWSLYPNTISKKVVALKPISSEIALKWFREKTEAVKNDFTKSVLSHVAKASYGIPLIMKLYTSRLTAKNKKPITVDDIPAFKENKNYKQAIDAALKWSFDSLQKEAGLLLVLQCASIFPKFIEEATLKSMFTMYTKASGEQSFGEDFIEQCADLSLIEYNRIKKKYHLHPYIQEYVLKTNSEVCRKLKYAFCIASFSKLMQITRKALHEIFNGDEPVEISYSLSSGVIREFLRFDFGELLQYYPDISKEPFINHPPSAEYLLNALLNLLAVEHFACDYHSLLLKFAENLRNLFLRISLFSHAVICQCFIIQIDPNPINLRTNMKILEEEYEIKLEPDKSSFCLSYLHYTKGHFIQRTGHDSNETKMSSHACFEKAKQELHNWSSDVISQSENSEEGYLFELIVKSEKAIFSICKLGDDLVAAVKLIDDGAIKSNFLAMMNQMEEVGYPLGFLHLCFTFSRALQETDERFTVDCKLFPLIWDDYDLKFNLQLFLTDFLMWIRQKRNRQERAKLKKLLASTMKQRGIECDKYGQLFKLWSLFLQENCIKK